MAFNSIDLTPADAVAQKEIFQREMADILGSRQLAILPPFPDYSLSQSASFAKSSVEACKRGSS